MKRAETQVIAHLPSKCESLNSNLTTTEKKKIEVDPDNICTLVLTLLPLIL
jgi:hypothetical protein